MLMLEMFLMNVESLMSYLQNLWSEVKIFLLSGETLAVLKSGLPFSHWLWQTLPSHKPVMSFFFFVFWPSHGEISTVAMVVEKWQWAVMINDCIECDNHDHNVLWTQNWSLSILGAGFPQLDKVWTWTGKGLCPCKTAQRAGLTSHSKKTLGIIIDCYHHFHFCCLCCNFYLDC